MPLLMKGCYSPFTKIWKKISNLLFCVDEIGIKRFYRVKMKNFGLIICTLVVFSACGASSSNEVVTEGSVKHIEADTISKDTLKIEKRNVPTFPNNEDEEMETMDEIVNRAKNQKL